METHDLPQGSPEWHQHRATHFNASDAPAMMGHSPYQTRTQLLTAMHTQHREPVDAATQRRFAEGHRFEALARPLAEKMIGEDLYPVVGSLGRLSASFDGLTMAQDAAFEHKSLNAELSAFNPASDTLPIHYRIQMEQQLLISGADKVLFMATKWEHDDLIDSMSVWYYPDPELREQIIAGWEQFAKDLESYQHVEVLPPVAATVQEALPAVVVRMDGALTVASNLPDFEIALRDYIGKIPVNPSTDQDFADCEAACKSLKNAEDALQQAEESALSQMSDVEQMRRVVGNLRALARATRLANEKLVKTQKENIRVNIQQGGALHLAAHIASLNKRLGGEFMPRVPANFAMAMANKKTLASLRDAVSTELASAKIAANEIADGIQANLKTLEPHQDYLYLFPDLKDLVLKADDDFKAQVENRIQSHQKAQAEQLERDRARIAEQERVKAEAAVRAEQDRLAPLRNVLVEAANQMVSGVDCFPAPLDGDKPIAQMPFFAPPEKVSFPTLTLGMIRDRFEFGMSEEFIRRMGIEPAAKAKNAVLYHEYQFEHICVGLHAHINAVFARSKHPQSETA